MDTFTEADIDIPFLQFYNTLKFVSKDSRYSYPGFISNLAINSDIKDLSSNNKAPLYQILGTNETLEIQAIDFTGTIALIIGKDGPEIKLGSNRLAYSLDDDSLIIHMMHFPQFILKKKYLAAIDELEKIGLWAHKLGDVRLEFYYLLAQGFTYDLMGKKELSKDYFNLVLELFDRSDALSVTMPQHIEFMLSYRQRHSVTKNLHWDDLISGLIFDKIFDNQRTGEFNLVNEIRIRAGMPIREGSPRMSISSLLGIPAIEQVPGRFSVELFIHNLDPDSLVQDLDTGESFVLSEILEPNNTMRMMTLDFAGTIQMVSEKDRNNKIKLSINDLVFGIEDDSILAHQIYFARFMSQFNPPAALAELEQLQKRSHKLSKRDEFFYKVAHARVWMRMRDRPTRLLALNAFEAAYDFFFTNFTEEEIDHISYELSMKMVDSTDHNWDHYLFSYDQVSLIRYLVSVAILLNLASPNNKYGLLLNEGLALADRFDLIGLRFHITDTLGELNYYEGNTEKAIALYLDVISIADKIEESSVRSTSYSPIFAIEFLTKLHLQKGEVNKAIGMMDQLISRRDYSQLREAHIIYFVGMSAIRTHQGKPDEAIDYGLRLFEYLVSINGKIFLSTNMFYIAPIFDLMIHAIRYNRSDVLSRLDKIIYHIFEKNSQIADCRILISLIRLCQAQFVSTDEYSINNIHNMQEEYKKILRIDKLPMYSIKKTIAHHLYFMVSNIDRDIKISEELINLSYEYYERTLDSNNILLTMKCYIIHMVMSHRIPQLRDWLQEIGKYYALSPLKEMIDGINILEDNDDLTTIKEELMALLHLDVINDQYSLYHAKSVSQIITDNKIIIPITRKES